MATKVEKATKLKNLTIKKVDFVEQGANPEAFIKFLKNKDGIPFSDAYKTTLNRKICDEIWTVCSALTESLCSIIDNKTEPNKKDKLLESLSQFNEFVKNKFDDWTSSVSSTEITKKINKIITKKGKDETEMGALFDATKFTPEEASTFATLIAKACGTDNTDEPNTTKKQTDDEEEKEKKPAGDGGTVDDEKPEKKSAKDVTKSAVGDRESANSDVGAGGTDGNDDIYKGMHPAVVAELEQLRKARESAETRELIEIAKKYALLGKTPETLVPVLKSLKAAGGTAYDEMISVLDASLKMVEKNGIFNEIGKSGDGTMSVNKSVSKANALAEEIRKSNPKLTIEQAQAQAWESNPDLLAQYMGE